MQQNLGDIDTLIREEKRLTSVESHNEAWADGLSAGIEPEIIADAALATAFRALVAQSGEEAALAMIERMRERIEAGEFHEGRTCH